MPLSHDRRYFSVAFSVAIGCTATLNLARQGERYIGQGMVPSAYPAKYCALYEVHKKSLELRQSSLKLLNSLSEADLDKPTKTRPQGLEHLFSTFGQSFITLALHQISHRSHVTNAKREAGRMAIAA